MRNYWTCSKFADWIRGTSKLDAGTSEEWDDWKKTAQAKYPIRWWIAEEGLDKLQTFLYWPTDKLYAIKYYINNRFISRTHCLTADPQDIKPGQWRDVGNRFLPCLFNELVNFVEVELAWMHLAWEGKEVRAKYRAPWWRFGWWNIRLWRCPQAGIDHLIWQTTLVLDENSGVDSSDKNYGKPTPQAESAKEVLALYRWWTETYRNRPDPMDTSGWSVYCDKVRDSGLGLLQDVKDPNLKKEQTRTLKLLHKIEADYEREDEEMLIRLIKVRNSLWT